MTTSAVNAGMSFEDAMSSVSSISGATGMSFGKLSTKGQSGYSQSASLLAHNRIAASQLIRSGLYHS